MSHDIFARKVVGTAEHRNVFQKQDKAWQAKAQTEDLWVNKLQAARLGLQLSLPAENTPGVPASSNVLRSMSTHNDYSVKLQIKAGPLFGAIVANHEQQQA